MRVITGFRYDYGAGLTQPFPRRKWSVVLRVVGGNWLDPIGGDRDWFKPPHPCWVINVWVPLWVSWLLLIASTSLLIAALTSGPWWSWPIAAALWVAAPGKYIAWRFDSRGGYLGSKVYGVDAPIYREWLCNASQVYPGSLAFCQSFRPFATLSAAQQQGR